MAIIMWSLNYYTANFWLLLCTHALVTFLMATYIAKKLYEKLKVVKCFLRFSIAIIQPKFKKISQIYIHGSSNYSKILKNFFKTLVSYLAYSQIKWLNLAVNHCHLICYITKLTKLQVDMHNV
jgi:hypothetical protein